MGRSPLLSLAVKVLLRTWPNSIPVLVTQAAVPAAAPASFLVTYYKVEKNNRYSNYNNCVSNKRNIFELGGWGRGGVMYYLGYLICLIPDVSVFPLQTKDYYGHKLYLFIIFYLLCGINLQYTAKCWRDISLHILKPWQHLPAVNCKKAACFWKGRKRWCLIKLWDQNQLLFASLHECLTTCQNIGTLNVHELFWMLQCNFNASV